MSQSSSVYSEPDYYIPVPKTLVKGLELTRDDRLKIQTLYLTAGWSKDDIALQLNVSLAQIQYALSHRLTPQKQRSGRRPLLGLRERKQLIQWVCASSYNRRVPWHEIPAILGWDCKVYAIQTAFKIEGFSRRSALKKPKLTIKGADIRLQWGLEHRNWTLEQWEEILWTDESWVQPGCHKKVKVTRRPDEALHRDCIEEKVQRRIGWMF
jgi:transposase